jgi:hypothetical protein
MAKKPAPTERDKELAAERLSDRITEKDGAGLIITRLDGTRERVLPGGRLEKISE